VMVVALATRSNSICRTKNSSQCLWSHCDHRELVPAAQFGVEPDVRWAPYRSEGLACVAREY
jgi:hypothetical protein